MIKDTVVDTREGSVLAPVEIEYIESDCITLIQDGYPIRVTPDMLREILRRHG